MFESGLHPAGVPSQISHVSPGKSYFPFYVSAAFISLPGCALSASGRLQFLKEKGWA